MRAYQLLEFLHILSSMILFGTGLGIAYFMLMAVNSRNIEAIRVTLTNVVRADWVFTTPVVIIQPVTGLWLMHLLNFSFASTWFLMVMGLYILAGACWIPVVIMQYRMRDMANAAPSAGALPQEFSRMFFRWKLLGYTAFIALLVILFLMLFKPGL